MAHNLLQSVQYLTYRGPMNYVELLCDLFAHIHALKIISRIIGPNVDKAAIKTLMQPNATFMCMLTNYMYISANQIFE